MCTITLNNEKNGIEIRFEEKPVLDIISKLKENGFRWSNRQHMWYAKKTDDRLSFVNSLSSQKTNAVKENKVENDNVYDLWTLTRIESIGKHEEENLTTKEIAAIIRKHFRKRFPMFKFSVTSDYDSISVQLMESPYEKKSEEAEAVLEYAGEYVESYKQVCKRGDFYGGRNYPCYSYECVFREMTVSELNIRELFKKKKEEWQEKENKRIIEEAKIAAIKAEQERIESEKRWAEREKCRKLIEESVIVKEVNYFVIGLIDPGFAKADRLSSYMEEKHIERYRRTNAKVKRNIYLTNDIYEMFINQFMDDYSFLAKTGGSRTDDYRVNSIDDFYQMSQFERDTVEWYSCDCVAVYCNDELKLVIDAQGYSYARYVFIVDEKTEVKDDYIFEQFVSEELRNSNKAKAEVIEDASTEIIINNGWKDTWNTDNQIEYIDKIISWVYENKIKITKRIIQQISSDNLKKMMYRVLAKIDSLQEQFKIADLKEGQKVTIIQISDFGGLVCSKVAVHSVEYTGYAQYDKAVKFICKPINKRKYYYKHFYRDVIIVDGWVDIPENVLFDIEDRGDFIVKKSKYLSCDKKQYEEVSLYLKRKDIIPIINTYDPENRV